MKVMNINVNKYIFIKNYLFFFFFLRYNSIVMLDEGVIMENKKNIIIGILCVIIVVLIAVIGFIIGTKYADKEKDIINESSDVESNTEINDNNTENEDTNITFKNYTLENISNIVINKLCDNCIDPEFDVVTISNQNDIKYILKQLDDATLISTISDEFGFEFLFNIEITYNEDPSTVVIFLDNGNVAINYSVGVGETGYGEYKLSNTNLKNELIEKYFQ